MKQAGSVLGVYPGRGGVFTSCKEELLAWDRGSSKKYSVQGNDIRGLQGLSTSILDRSWGINRVLRLKFRANQLSEEGPNSGTTRQAEVAL